MRISCLVLSRRVSAFVVIRAWSNMLSVDGDSYVTVQAIRHLQSNLSASNFPQHIRHSVRIPRLVVVSEQKDIRQQ